MTVGGTRYSERKEAGSAILGMCGTLRPSTIMPIGEYKGFEMFLSYNTLTQEYIVSLKGTLTHDVGLGADALGNIARINNKLEGLPDMLRKCQERLADIQAQFAAAKEEVQRPFPQEREYEQKLSRLQELNILLNMDQKVNEIFDIEPDSPEREEDATYDIEPERMNAPDGGSFKERMAVYAARAEAMNSNRKILGVQNLAEVELTK